MNSIYNRILEEMEAGRGSILATVVMRKGSAPRGLGTKMLVKSDGGLVGTVGGGLLEGNAVAKAGEMLKSGGSALVLDFDLMDKEAEACGMICGGYVNLYLEFMDPSDEDLKGLVQRLARITGEGRTALAAMRTDENRAWARRYLVSREGPEVWPSGDWPEDLEVVRKRFEQGGALRPGWLGDYFVEPVLAGPTVYIFGGGHVSGHIAPLASLVDFRVKVIDDREEFASVQRFPQADEVIRRSFEGAVESLDITESGYIVIVTRGHAWDGAVLADALKTPAVYIGMIGSRHKRKAIYDKLLSEGFTEEDLKRVHSPIGLDIGGETPEEIAVAIVAELIQARSRAIKGPGPKSWKV